MLITVFSSVSIGVSAVEYEKVDAPDVYEIETSFSSVKLYWEYRYAPYRFLVYRSDTGKKGTWTKIAVTEEDARSYTDTTVVPGKTYYYTVKTYRKIDDFNRVYISDMSGKHKATTMIERPEFQLVGNGGYGVVLKWDTDRDMSGVVIYRSMSGKKGTWSKIKVIKNKNTNTYTDSNVNIGETYYYCYKVYKTINGKNYYSQSSKAYKSKIMDVSIPEDLKVTAVKDGVRIEYSKALGTAGYVIYRSESGKKGTWSRVKVTTSNNTRKFTDTTAKKGKTYYYTVKSYKTVNGVTKYSEPAKAKKVVNDPSYPVFEFSSNEITFTSFYGKQRVIFYFKNVNENDSIRIFYNDIELTEEILNDEKKVEEFVSNCDFFYYVEEDKISYDSMSLFIYRLGPGGGTLRFQHSKYDDVYAEIKVNCPELDFDTDRLLIYENIDLFYANVHNAWKTLEAAQDLSNDLEIGKEVKKAKEYLYAADDCLIEARRILNEYKYYSGNDEYTDLDVEIADLSGCLVFDIAAIDKISEISPEKDKIKNLCAYLAKYFNEQ